VLLVSELLHNIPNQLQSSWLQQLPWPLQQMRGGMATAAAAESSVLLQLEPLTCCLSPAQPLHSWLLVISRFASLSGVLMQQPTACMFLGSCAKGVRLAAGHHLGVWRWCGCCQETARLSVPAVSSRVCRLPSCGLCHVRSVRMHASSLFVRVLSSASVALASGRTVLGALYA